MQKGGTWEKEILRDTLATVRDEKQQKGSYVWMKDELKLGCLLKM